MAMKEVLSVIVTGDAKGLVKEFDKVGVSARKNLGDTDDRMRRLAGSMTVVGAGAVVAGGALAAMGLKASNAYVAAARDALKLQRVTGATAQDASRLAVVAQQSGIQVDKLATAFVRLSKQSDTTKGREALDQLGVSLENANGSARAMPVVLSELAAKFESMPGGVDKNRLALQLFGRAGADLLPLLNKGAEGIDAIVAKADQLGLTLDQSDLDGVRAYTQAQRDLGLAWQGLQVQVGKEIFPAVTAGLKTATDTAMSAVKAFKDLPEPLKQMAGKVAGIGTAGLIVTGGLSVMAGQASKALNNFTVLGEGGVRSLNNIGKAAAITGAAVAAISVGFVLDALGKSDSKQYFDRITAASKGSTQEILSNLDAAGTAAKGFTDNFTQGFSDSLLKFADGTGASLADIDRALGDAYKANDFATITKGIEALRAAASAPINAPIKGDILAVISDYEGKLKDSAAANKAAGDAAGTAGDDVEGGGAQVSAAAQAWKDYGDAIKASTDPLFAVTDSAGKMADAQAKVLEAQKAVNESGTVENVKKLAEAQRDATKAGLDHLASVVGLRAGIESGDVTLEAALGTLDALQAAYPELSGAIGATRVEFQLAAAAANAVPSETKMFLTGNADQFWGVFNKVQEAQPAPKNVPVDGDLGPFWGQLELVKAAKPKVSVTETGFAASVATAFAGLPTYRMTIKGDVLPWGLTAKTKQADGGVRTAANGSLPDRAVIQPGSGAGLIQWAEGETGGEAFIPLAPAKRNRSLRIWQETGRRLGAMADGGFGGRVNPNVWLSINPEFDPLERDYKARLKAEQDRAMATGGGAPGSWQKIIQFLQNTGVPYHVLGTWAKRNVRGTNRPSLHSFGRAVDLTGPHGGSDNPELLAIYRALTRMPLTELIYSGPGGSNPRNPITAADHHNHVHAALRNGGVRAMAGGGVVSAPTLALIGEAGPEAVIPMRSFAAGGFTSDDPAAQFAEALNNIWQNIFDSSNIDTQITMAYQRRDAVAMWSDEWVRWNDLAISKTKEAQSAMADIAAKAAEDQQKAAEAYAAAQQDIAENQFSWMYDHASDLERLQIAISKRDSFGAFTDDWMKWAREVEEFQLAGVGTARNVASGGRSQGSAPFYLTVNVNAEGLVTDPTEVGRQVVGAIRSYETQNGTAWRS